MPVVVLVVSVARGRRAAAELGLLPARRRAFVLPAALAAAACGLLGLAAAQPVLRTTEERLIRSESQIVFVVDVSRSMRASAGPDEPTRLARARTAVTRLRDAVPDVPAGLAGLTDRVLPYVFPTADAASFAGTLRRSVAAESPPPQAVETVATSFGALASLARDNFFAAGVERRTCVVLTDGETRPFESGDVARALRGDRGCRLVAVQLWEPGERIFDAEGRPEARYRPDPAARSKLERLASVAGGSSFDETQLAGAAAAVRTAAQTGPTTRSAETVETHALAPALAGAALLLVLALVAGRLATAKLRKATRVSYRPSFRT